MRLHTRHLACVLLLLSSLGSAQASTLSTHRLSGSYIDVLLARSAAHAATDFVPTETHVPATTAVARALPSSARATTRFNWTPLPPALHAAALQTASSALPTL